MLPVLAFSISDTSLFICSKHLPVFALWTIFSPSLVRRDAHDYYPGSVTLSLSTRRAIPSSLNTRRVEPAVGAAFAPLSEVILRRSLHGRFTCR